MSAIVGVMIVEECNFCHGKGEVKKRRCAACAGTCMLHRPATRTEVLRFLGLPDGIWLTNDALDRVPNIVGEVVFGASHGPKPKRAKPAKGARVIPIGRARKRGSR